MERQKPVPKKLGLALGAGGTAFLEDIRDEDFFVELSFIKSSQQKPRDFSAFLDQQRASHDFSVVYSFGHKFSFFDSIEY
jgi:S-formylglutathione hydrolase FrmB